MERSKKVVFVSHCLLNQNTRSVGKSSYPGTVRELISMLSEAGIGIIQLPCPEIEFNSGLHRKNQVKKLSSSYKNACKKLSSNILKQIETYMAKKYKVIGIIVICS